MTAFDKLINILTCWFGAGALPGPKGTWGSLAALPFAWLIYYFFQNEGLFVASIICFFIGIIVVDFYVKRTKTKDPSFAVIDEVAGQWISLVVLNQATLVGFLIGFLFFRFFDILKPTPCRMLEKLPNGLGVMADDMVAGIYAAICLYVIQLYMPNIFILYI
jgi:phosphatidylglycerophosphatase A